jgi:tetratricopeptide (TPR) repeat protein
MNWKSLGWGMLMGMLSVHANAAEPWAPSDTEMTSLPPYCKVRFKSGAQSPEYKMWEKTLGKDFLHTHHYCAGVNFINRYYRARSQQDKQFNLRSAQATLNYMVEKASPSYSLMPDVYLNLGVVYLLTNQTAQAVTHFNKAIELNPRQPKAYNALSDYYAKTKQSAKALEIVTTGLRHNPDIKSLQRRYTDLGGKLPYPEPFEPASAAEVQPVEQKEPAEPASSPASTAPAPVAPIAEPSIGSPTNPYCRFCPD